MNYLKYLTEKDIAKTLEKCNLEINNDTPNSLIYSKNKDFVLISCKKIVLDKSDEALNDLIKNFTSVLKTSPFIEHFTKHGIILYMSNFELIDNFNKEDYSNILYDTIYEKLRNNKKLQARYKKEFTEYHSNELSADKNNEESLF